MCLKNKNCFFHPSYPLIHISSRLVAKPSLWVLTLIFITALVCITGRLLLSDVISLLVVGVGLRSSRLVWINITEWFHRDQFVRAILPLYREQTCHYSRLPVDGDSGVLSFVGHFLPEGRKNRQQLTANPHPIEDIFTKWVLSFWASRPRQLKLFLSRSLLYFKVYHVTC